MLCHRLTGALNCQILIASLALFLELAEAFSIAMGLKTHRYPAIAFAIFKTICLTLYSVKLTKIKNPFPLFFLLFTPAVRNKKISG
jgi:hypothetical protein